MKTPADKSIAFTFASHPTKNPVERWKAVLSFPPDAGPESVLTISLIDGNGNPVEEGVFEFAGRKLRVSAGSTELTYADFIRGKHETALWVYRPGMPPIPGGLTFS